MSDTGYLLWACTNGLLMVIALALLSIAKQLRERR